MLALNEPESLMVRKQNELSVHVTDSVSSKFQTLNDCIKLLVISVVPFLGLAKVFTKESDGRPS